MNWILKNKKTASENLVDNNFAQNKIVSQRKKIKALFVVLFLVFGFGIFFSNSADAQAGTCRCDNGVITSAQAAADASTAFECNNFCIAKNLQRYEFNGGAWTNITSSAITPLQQCIDSGGTGFGSGGKCTGCEANGKVTGAGNGAVCQTQAEKNASLNSQSPAADAHAADAGTKKDFFGGDICAEGMFTCSIKELLLGVFSVVGWLFAIAATLFSWSIEPANVSGSNGMLNKQAVKDVWIMVRDLLNMTFILILLFSAFCTIFQVEKWNLKKVWLNILINALLVNFSFPIARFFIDVSNVAFYYFVNHLFTSTGIVTGNSIFANLGTASKLGSILEPTQYAKADIAYIIAMIVLVFILGMTLLVIAALFVVRLVALTMLVMFSPIGFVGYIFPSTANFADKWWTQLFSYSFFAPIMIFIMAIALRIMEVMGNENFNSFNANASANAPDGQAAWIANAAFFIIPVIILWMGMGVAKSAGVAGADTVVGGVQKGGKWVSNQIMSGSKWAAYGNPVARGIKEGVKEKAGINKLTKWWKAPSHVEAGIKGGIVGMGTSKTMFGGARSELEKLQYQEIRDAVEEHKKNKTNHSQLSMDLDSTNKIKAIAAAMALAENDDIRNADELTRGLAVLANDPNLTSKFIQKGHSAVQDFASLKSVITALGNDNKSIGTLIEKVGPNVMNMNPVELADLISSTTLGTGAGTGVKKQLESRMKKEGHVQTLVTIQANAAGGTMADFHAAYDDLVADMTPADLAKQKDTLHNDANFVDYVMNNSGPNQTFSAEHRKNVFAELSGKKKSIWANNGIHP